MSVQFPAPHAFIPNRGVMGGLTRAYDWSATPLGAIERWPGSLKAAVALMLHSDVAMTLLWGPDGVMLYNDAYAHFAGGRHPRILGAKVLEAWPEVADFNAHVMRTGLAGGTLSFRDQHLVLHRNGVAEDVWLSLDYSPVPDESGTPAGVLAIVVETTRQVRVQETLRIAQSAGGVGTFEWYPDTGQVEVSDEYRRLWGIAADAKVDAALLVSLLHPEDRALTGPSRRGQVNPLEYAEYRVRRPDTGELRWIARRGEVVASPQGGQRRFVGVAFDITDRKNSEAALLESEARWRGLFERMQEGFVVGEAIRDAAGHMRDFRFVEVNPAFEAHTGIAVGDAVGRCAREVIPGIEDEVLEAYARVLDTGVPEQFESHVQALGGRWYEIRARRLAPERFAVMFLEITARKQVEAALGASEERFRTLAESLPNHVWTAPADGRLDWFNRQVYDYSGATAEELRGDGWIRLVHPDDLAAVGAWREALATGTRYQAEFRLRRADGAYRWHIAHAMPTRDAQGAITRWIGTSTDIEDQKAAETALKQLAATLEERVAARTAELTQANDALRQSQKMEAVGQLTGGIAHDFNNLLQGIVGSLNLVQKRIAIGQPQGLERFIESALASSYKAAALTHRLLAFSRRQPLDPKPLKANPLVSSMEDLLRRTLGERIGLELVTAGGLWPTLCDANQLESAILNLVINARDAMPDGGKLTIETGNSHLDTIYAAAAGDVKPGQYVCISVTDTGTGMTLDVLERAFDPFFTTKPIGQGTGLGLSMIYGFTRQSEGCAKIYSEVGRGTTVKLYLPRYRGEMEEPEPLPGLTAAHAAGDGETVLVIEDDAVIRGLVVEVLHELGYRAFEAADGPAGLSLLQSPRRIDLLVTDIGLPGLNGRQVADAARTTRPALKVLFMTGYAENAALANGFLEPGMSMITKPFSMEALATRIRMMIEGD